MKIAIIGAHGYVGRQMCRFFARGHDVIKRDTADPETVTWEEINNAADLVVVCVPTPMAADGSADVSIVEEAVRAVGGGRMVLIKSTVPPGTSDRLRTETGRRIVFSPEFAGESRYHSSYDFDRAVAASPWFIFGATHGDFEAASQVADLYSTICGPEPTYEITRATTAELVKYWANCHAAAKVTLANELRRICGALGVDYHVVRRLWLLDPRVNAMHTLAFRDQPGFDGKCFPKDLAALIAACKAAHYSPAVLESIQTANQRFRAAA